MEIFREISHVVSQDSTVNVLRGRRSFFSKSGFETTDASTTPSGHLVTVGKSRRHAHSCGMAQYKMIFVIRCNAYNEGRQVFMPATCMRARGLCTNTSNVTSQIDTLKVVCESVPKQLARFVIYCMDKKRDALYK